MRIIKHLPLVLTCLFLAACPRSDTAAKGSDTDIASNLFIRFPEPGEVIFHPPVPVFPSAGREAPNILTNADFGSGLAYWEVSGTSRDESAGFNGFSATGDICCHALSSADGDVFVHQVVNVMPSTFYHFSALVFAPGDSEAFAEARSEDGQVQLAGETVSGPMKAWTKVSLTFVTGRETENVRIGVSCHNGPERTPVWVDQARLHSLPVDNLFSRGGAEFAPDEEDDSDPPEWFVNRRTASPVSPGYESAHSFRLPAPIRQPSRLYGLIHDYERYAGRPVWITAIARLAEDGGAPAQDAALNVYLTDTVGGRAVLASAVPVAADWSEISFQAEMPALEQGESSVRPPFHALVFELERGGSILIDEICVFPIPDGFEGGVAAARGAA